MTNQLPLNAQQIRKSQKDLTIPKFHRRIMVVDTETSGLMPKHKPGTPFPPIEAFPHIMQFSWILYNVLTNEFEEMVNEYVRIPRAVVISPKSIDVHKITREITEEKGKPIVPLLVRFFESYMKCDCIVGHNLHFDGEMIRKEMWRNRKELNAKIKIPDRVNMMCGVFTKRFNAAYHIDMFCTMMNTIEFCGIEFDKKPVATPVVTDGFDADETKKPGVSFDVDSTLITLPESNINQAQLEKEKDMISTTNENTRKKFPRLNELYSKLFDDVLPTDLHNSIIDVLVCLRCFLKVRAVKEMSETDFYSLIEKYSR